MAMGRSENWTSTSPVCRHQKCTFLVWIAFVLALSEAKEGVPHLTMVTSNFNQAGSSYNQIRLACFHSSVDGTDNPLSFGRPFPIALPGAGIQSSTSLPNGTIAGGAVLRFPLANNNAVGLFYCEGSVEDQTSRVYSIITNDYTWSSPGDYHVTKTVNKGDDITLSVNGRYGRDINPVWRLISDGTVTNLTAFDGMTTITVPSDQAKYGDLYVVINSGQSISDNSFTLIRLIVRGCVAGKWGPPDCDVVCDLCYSGGVCDDKTGDCICPPGFSGANCLTVCPPDSFGQECEFQCGNGHLLSSCDHLQFGLPDPYGISCLNGYHGEYCSSGCPSLHFGAGCLLECHCQTYSGCDEITGQCTTGGCARGWTGTNCQIPDICPTGYYGLNCLSKCHCNNDAACNKHTGYCSEGCASKFTCVSRQCELGYFGQDCSKECHCLDDAACDGLTGSCQRGRCLEQYQTDGSGICQFVLPVLRRPPEVAARSTSATVSWEAWGSNSMDAGNGPIIGYQIYHTDPTTGSWVDAGNVAALHQPLSVFSFEIESLRQWTVYNFSVAVVREGQGGEGPRSSATTVKTQPQATTAESNAGLVVAICMLAFIVIILVVLNYLQFRRFSRRSKNPPSQGGLDTKYMQILQQSEAHRFSTTQLDQDDK